MKEMLRLIARGGQVRQKQTSPVAAHTALPRSRHRTGAECQARTSWQWPGSRDAMVPQLPKSWPAHKRDTVTHIHEMGFAPARFLAENTSILPKGRALDLAMGNGRNAIYLATLGFEVEGIDISPGAVNSALEQARKRGVSLHARVADLEGDYRIERDAYHVILCFNYLQRSLIPQVKNGLRMGGMVVYETFIVDQAKFGRPKNPDYLLKHNELLEMFREFRCLRYREGIVGKERAVASIIAEKI
jgi:tellurite methyltransferase